MNNNKQQTAVEWLSKKTFIPVYFLEQAKAMEKEQIMDAYNDGANERHNEPVNGEQYYKEEYGKQ